MWICLQSGLRAATAVSRKHQPTIIIECGALEALGAPPKRASKSGLKIQNPWFQIRLIQRTRRRRRRGVQDQHQQAAGRSSDIRAFTIPCMTSDRFIAGPAVAGGSFASNPKATDEGGSGQCQTDTFRCEVMGRKDQTSHTFHTSHTAKLQKKNKPVMQYLRGFWLVFRPSWASDSRVLSFAFEAIHTRWLGVRQPNVVGALMALGAVGYVLYADLCACL